MTASHNTDGSARALSEFLDDGESTLNDAVCNSIGVAMLALGKIFPKARKMTPQEIEKTLIPALHTFNIPEATIKDVVGFICEYAENPVGYNKPLNLYLPDEKANAKGVVLYKEVTMKLELQEVLNLIWEASNADARHIQHYQLDEKEEEEIKAKDTKEADAARLLKLTEKAKKDKPARLLTLYRSFERIKSGVCPKGSINILGLTQNHTFGIEADGMYSFKCLSIIEEPTLETHQFLKDKLGQRFWARFDNPEEDKQVLASALYGWMESGNPQKMIQLLDPKKEIKAELFQHFRDHGNNPEKTECGTSLFLPEVVDRAYKVLNFDCDAERYPVLAKMQGILQAPPLEGHAKYNAAMTKMKAWIKTHYQFRDLAHEQIIHRCYAFVYAHAHFIQHQTLLVVTGKLSAERCQSYATQFENYFSDVVEKEAFPLGSEESIASLTLLNTAIATVKKVDLMKEIETFFDSWVSALEQENNNDVYKPLESLYSLLLHQQDKILMSDATLENFTLTDSPYIIHRVILHAILQRQEHWSSSFLTAFTLVRNFLKINQENKFKNTRKTLRQLDYLWDEYLYKQAMEDSSVRKPERPSVLNVFLHSNHRGNVVIWMPDRITNVEEWRRVYFSASRKELEVIYQRLRIWIDRLVLDQIHLKSYEYIINLPDSRKEPFIKQHWSLLLDNLVSGGQVADLLNAKRETLRRKFFEKHQSIFMRVICGDTLGLVLEQFSKTYRKQFFVLNSRDLLKLIVNASQLASVLKPFKQADREWLFRKFETRFVPLIRTAKELENLYLKLSFDFCQKLFLQHCASFWGLIQNGEELGLILAQFLQEFRGTLMISNAATLPQKIRNGKDLAKVFDKLPNALCASLFFERVETYLEKIANGEELALILKRFPDPEILRLFQERGPQLIAKCKTGSELIEVWKEYPEKARLALFKRFAPSCWAKIPMIAELVEVIDVFSDDDKEKFFAETKEEWLTRVVSYEDAAAVLFSLPEAKRFIFLVTYFSPSMMQLQGSLQGLLLIMSSMPVPEAFYIKEESVLCKNIKSFEELDSVGEMLSDSVQEDFYVSALWKIPFVRTIPDYPEKIPEPYKEAAQRMQNRILHPVASYAESPDEFVEWLKVIMQSVALLMPDLSHLISVLRQVANVIEDKKALSFFNATLAILHVYYSTTMRDRRRLSQERYALYSARAATVFDNLSSEYHVLLAAILWEGVQDDKRRSVTHLTSAVEKGATADVQTLLAGRQAELRALETPTLLLQHQGLFGEREGYRQRRAREEQAPTLRKEAFKRVKF